MARRRTGKARSRAQHRTILHVEQLEDRSLLAADLSSLLAPQAWAAVMPNDANFGSQYALNNTGQTGGKVDADIDAPEAWDVTTGSLSTIVGVVDSGVDYKHVDLYKNIWINQAEIPSTIRSKLIDTDGDGIITFWDLNDSRNQGAGKITDLNGNGRIDGGDILKPVSQGGWADGVDNDKEGHVDDLIGWDFINNDNDPYDDNGHGTHVSGIIGAMGNNGVGVTGVDWRVRIMPLKFLGADATGSVAGAVSAIDYAIAHGVAVTNHSWAMGDYFWQPIYDAMNRARAAGQVIVAAAGNGGSDGIGDNSDVTPTYPASFGLDNVVSVAATTSSDGLASYSNYGKASVDLGAPGSSILSTGPGDKYIWMGGTSMATPFVTGTIALVRSQHPDWSYSQVIHQVLATVDPISALSGKTVTGGRLNAAKAVGAGLADTVGPRVVSLTANGASTGPISSVRVTFSEAIDPATFTAADIVSFTGPNGAIAVTGVQVVSGSGNKAFDVTFGQQTAFGNYSMTLGPDVRDTHGNRMDQDRDGVNGESVQDRYTGTFAINRVDTYVTGGVNLADFATTKIPLVVDRDITIQKLTVSLTITHPTMGDLYIHLRGPDGTDVLLFNRRGGTGDNMKATLFDDAASNSVSTAVAPFGGTLRPEALLSAFNGKNAHGTWTLIVEDRAAGDRGRDNLFILNIEEAPSSGATSIAESSSEAPVAGESLSVSTHEVADAGTEVNSLVIDVKREQPVARSIRAKDADRVFAQEAVAASEPIRLGGALRSLLTHARDSAEPSDGPDFTVDRLMACFSK